MAVKTLEDIQGYEYDWLGSDKLGQVALFSTAGVGYVPSAFLSNIEAFDQVIDSILRLPVSASAKTFPKIANGLPNTWKQVAERGIYGYDADLSGDSYKLVSIPDNSIIVDNLPPEVASVVKQVNLGEILFGSMEGISKSEIIKYTKRK